MTEPTLKDRAEQLARQLLAALDDPAADADRAAFDAQKARDDAATTLAYHLSKTFAKPRVPPHRDVALRDVGAMREYLRDRGERFIHTPAGIALDDKSGRVAVDWLADRVEVVAPVALDVGDGDRARLAALLEHLNRQIGRDVWRLDPTLRAVVTAPLDGGALASGSLEHAIALARQVVLRDPATFRMVLRSQT
jgi:hypothetical protein